MLRLFFVAALLLAIPPGLFSQVRPISRPAPQLAAVATPEPAEEDTSEDDSAADDETADEATPAPSVNPATTPPRPVPPRVATNPPAPATPRATPAANAGDEVNLQFPNSDVDDVLRMYENLTGKKLVRDNFVQGKVNLFINKKLPREEAIRIIEINLLLNGFSLVPAGGDIVKVIGTGKNARSAGVPLISDDSQIPEGEHVVSYLFKLRYADPTELQQVLQQYLSQPGGAYSAVQPLPKAGAVLVTENSAVIRTIAKIVDQVDIPPAEVVSEFIKLERADATKVVDMLKEIFEKGPNQPGQPTTPPGVRAVRPPPQPVPQQVNVDSDLATLTALSEEAVVVGKIKMTPDVRTNRIHVVTRPINMPFIKKLISEFDANVEFAKPVTRTLRYVSAGDVLPVLVQALTEPGSQQQGGEGLGGTNPANQQQQQNRQNRPGTPNNPYSGGLSNSGGGGENSLNVSEELSTTATDTTPKAVTIGNAKIIADQRSNAIIVLGNREVVVKVAKILDEMDISAPQVALSTVIGELTLSGNEEFGVDWFLRYKNKAVAISRNNGAPLPSLGASPAPTAGATPVVSGGIIDPAGLVNFGQALQAVAGGTNVYVAAGNYLASTVHLLEGTGKFKVISRPTVFTSNNKKAIIASGQEVPVPVNTLTNATTTTSVAAVASSIQYKKIALQLEVVPLINSENEVSLDILQKIDSIAGSTTIDGNAIPTIATRYIRTNVSAPNCSTIVLGGLIADNNRKDYSGVPWLSRIPLLGAAFRSTTNSKTRQELIVLMRPEVAMSKMDLYRLRQKNEDKTHFGPEVEQDDCPDCPKRYDGKELPAPDLPPEKLSLNQ